MWSAFSDVIHLFFRVLFFLYNYSLYRVLLFIVFTFLKSSLYVFFCGRIFIFYEMFEKIIWLHFLCFVFIISILSLATCDTCQQNRFFFCTFYYTNILVTLYQKSNIFSIPFITHDDVLRAHIVAQLFNCRLPFVALFVVLRNKKKSVVSVLSSFRRQKN